MQNDITVLLHDIKSEKVKIREKSVETLYEIFCNSPNDVDTYIDDNDVSWDSIIIDVCISINVHAQKLLHAGKDVPPNDKKLNMIQKLLMKVFDSPKTGE